MMSLYPLAFERASVTGFLQPRLLAPFLSSRVIPDQVTVLPN
jgi:hypothetical protein